MSIVIIIILWVIVAQFVIKSLNKTKQRAQDHNRCEACKSRLKAVNGKYATTCRKCSHRQSWAVV